MHVMKTVVSRSPTQSDTSLFYLAQPQTVVSCLVFLAWGVEEAAVVPPQSKPDMMMPPLLCCRLMLAL